MNRPADPPPAGFRHVLLPLDGSRFALAALPTARALCERFHAELVTISVAAGRDPASTVVLVGVPTLGNDNLAVGAGVVRPRVLGRRLAAHSRLPMLFDLCQHGGLPRNKIVSEMAGPAETHRGEVLRSEVVL